MLFTAEFGELTQIAIANLAAKYHDPLAVGIGGLLGLWAVGAWLCWWPAAAALDFP
ncbi:MAG: TMEM165/GDT1 family protein [Pseudonocardiaceae bacterium]